jgi:2-polyprenyl-3-methyl-5-hydroxy-6-metoxy-1,4-benzoquinol methylase
MNQARECGDDDIVAGRGPGQAGWYEWAARHAAGRAVLDAGCGLGYGLGILARTASTVSGQDLDPRLASSRVHVGPLSELPSKSVDVVVSIDVIEHIADDVGFVRELARLAREHVILTTPNWTAGRGAWPYHVREYTPAHLRAVCGSVGAVRLWKGTPEGREQYAISRPAANHWLNVARVSPATAAMTRALNFVLPARAKIHSHLAAIIDVRF